jgi:hypothetical protein
MVFYRSETSCRWQIIILHFFSCPVTCRKAKKCAPYFHGNTQFPFYFWLVQVLNIFSSLEITIDDPRADCLAIFFAFLDCQTCCYYYGKNVGFIFNKEKFSNQSLPYSPKYIVGGMNNKLKTFAKCCILFKNNFFFQKPNCCMEQNRQ